MLGLFDSSKVNLTQFKVSPCSRLAKSLWPETSASVSFQRRGWPFSLSFRRCRCFCKHAHRKKGDLSRLLIMKRFSKAVWAKSWEHSNSFWAQGRSGGISLLWCVTSQHSQLHHSWPLNSEPHAQKKNTKNIQAAQWNWCSLFSLDDCELYTSHSHTQYKYLFDSVALFAIYHLNSNNLDNNLSGLQLNSGFARLRSSFVFIIHNWGCVNASLELWEGRILQPTQHISSLTQIGKKKNSGKI